MPNPPVVPSQKNSRVIGSHPASAYTAITARPVTLCASDAALGMLLPPVRPSAAGSTLSRPRAYMYRQTTLWNASAAANSDVRNSHCAACDSAPLPPRPNSSPGPCCPAAATTWPSPLWAAMAQLAPAYTTAIMPRAA